MPYHHQPFTELHCTEAPDLWLLAFSYRDPQIYKVITAHKPQTWSRLLSHLAVFYLLAHVCLPFLSLPSALQSSSRLTLLLAWGGRQTATSVTHVTSGFISPASDEVTGGAECVRVGKQIFFMM